MPGPSSTAKVLQLHGSFFLSDTRCYLRNINIMFGEQDQHISCDEEQH